MTTTASSGPRWRSSSREAMTDAWVRNPADETRIRYRDDGGPGLPVLVLGGFLDPIELVARTPVVAALPRDALRLIWVDHRGHGASDAPHEPEAYSIDLRVGDVVAVLDDLGIERAGILGISWGGRLGFGVADRAPRRVRSLVSIGQHPYELRADGPLGRVLAAAMDATATEGSWRSSRRSKVWPGGTRRRSGPPTWRRTRSRCARRGWPPSLKARSRTTWCRGGFPAASASRRATRTSRPMHAEPPTRSPAPGSS